MATPYLQVRLDSVASTMDEARGRLRDTPVVVMTPNQTRGRGRSGAEWLRADRALAVSLAAEIPNGDSRPYSLMAGLAVVRVVPGVTLKWPNDVLKDDLKMAGILVERSDNVIVVGLGLNIWWPSPPSYATALFEDDPGEEEHARLGTVWSAELLRMLSDKRWPSDEYRSCCTTIGREVTWEPDGSGRVVGVDDDGALLVETGDGVMALHSGAVSHVRAT